MQNKIVLNSLKSDFHIHSNASNHKDKNKPGLSECTIENTHILVDKIIENNINMFAITDHDNFDYDLYKKFKEEEAKENCIKLVVPGVEFSVIIDGTKLHVVALFDDTNENNIQKIQSLIYDKKLNKPLYNNGNEDYFNEERFIEILRTIDSNVILIAHQKNSLSSSHKRKNDSNNLGEEKFNELVFIEYFEAFEFKNKRNEIFNKSFLNEKKDELKSIKFVTGSDCHNWNEYPEENSDGDFEFCYYKCLPTFRGLMMSFTDSRRIKLGVDSFFSTSDCLEILEIEIDNEMHQIELSKGINVIIGDNSIGKSLLLHKLTDYRYLDKLYIKNAYDKYLLENNIDIKTSLTDNQIRQFDYQGNIRDIFSNSKTKSRDFLNNYYPTNPNYKNIKSIVINKIDEYINFITNLQLISDEEKKLSKIKLEFYDEYAMSLQITDVSVNFKDKETNLENLINEIKEIITKNNSLSENALLNPEEITVINDYNIFLNKLLEKYKLQKTNIFIEHSKINIINKGISNLTTSLESNRTELQKQRENFNTKLNNLKSTIVSLNELNNKNIVFTLNTDTVKLIPNQNIVGDYRFVCKSTLTEVNDKYIEKLLLYPLNSTYIKKVTDLTKVNHIEFTSNIKKAEDELDKLQYYKSVIEKKINDDFKIKPSINYKDDSDVTKELSSGANAKIYFELLSKDKSKPGIYIIDQPEDDVSQPSIKSKLLADFKQLSENRQVLMITHNPQFVVNLDVDNVIFIYKDEKTNKIKIINGALEYKDNIDDEYDILKVVADNIEGGIDSLKERYKKYEKNN